jgi:maltooligosyltrehalose trehalohydrolase
VHGPSQVVDQNFDWNDREWKNIPLEKYVIYELHVGTFTPEGTFEAIIPRIPELLELGVNAIELMPIAQFPGDRNWGYDGVYLYAAQYSYGGVNGLKRLVDACHQQGMAVIVDAVYNHFGPEGNYVGSYGPFYNDNYHSPWGIAVNFDNSYSYGVRDFFIQNAIYWFRDCHIDALRLDATDHILDRSAKHFLQELAEATAEFSQQQGRSYYLTAECDLGDVRWVRPHEKGGFGLDAQWNDEFHHALHALLTGESMGYYKDFGTLEQMAKGYTHNFVYTWNFSLNRQKYHGSDPSECSPSQFVVFSQNHDQVGNRLFGDRLCHTISFEAQKLAAAAVLISPSIPLIFMGEEYGETAPFQYFVSHGDPDLVEAVRKGRKEEFAAFHAEGEARDPQSETTFQESKLHWEQRYEGNHRQLWLFYQTLLRLRREIPAWGYSSRQNLDVAVLPEAKVITVRRWYEGSQILCLLNFNDQPAAVTIALPPGNWKKLLNSADSTWGGPGSDLPELIPTGDTPTGSGKAQISLSPQSAVIYSSS